MPATGFLRRHVTYANVVATLALLFAMSGGALAAKRYLITSTKQIKPSVLKKLRGAQGPRGAAGPKGTNGTKSNQKLTPAPTDINFPLLSPHDHLLLQLYTHLITALLSLFA